VPGTGNAAALAYGEAADLTGPIGQSVAGFLGTYLVGQSQLDRFVSPGQVWSCRRRPGRSTGRLSTASPMPGDAT
jgi:hypothetical protein